MSRPRTGGNFLFIDQQGICGTMKRLAVCLIAMLVAVLWCTSASARGVEPDWRGVVIARGAEREAIESLDILDRPYRPLHFYGNTVRRQYYRGRGAPALRDFARGTMSWITRQ